MTDSEGPARSRILPALLTALGVMLLAVGLLTYTLPVSADPPAATPEPERGRRHRRAADHPAAARLGRPEREPVRGPEPGLHAGPDRGARHRPAGGAAARRRVLPAVQRRDVDRRARAARPGPRDLPLRPRPAGDVPAAPQPVEDPERQEAARDGRRGLDERRPAVPVRDHRGPAPPDRASTTPRRPTTSSSGCRPRRARRAPSASSRSSPSRCRRRPRTTRRPTRSRTRSACAGSRLDPVDLAQDHGGAEPPSPPRSR